MKNRVLIDTNIIVRLTVRDHEAHYLIAKELFEKIENREVEVELLDIIIGEVIYVLHKIYDYSKDEIVMTLKKILNYAYVVVDNKVLMHEALEIFRSKNIDFADAMLCAKKNLEGYEVMSFDKDLKKC